MDHESVTLWLDRLADGDQSAARMIWGRYYEDVVRLARRKLGHCARRMADEEDVAVSAFHSFCQGLAANRFPQVGDRHDLWKLLATITARKVTAQLRRQFAQKRGGGVVVGESALEDDASSHRGGALAGIPDDAPPPDVAALLTEACERLIDSLDDASLQRVALLKLEGYTNEEIARELDCAVSTVERKLARIRKRWEGSRADEPDPRGDDAGSVTPRSP